MFTVFTAWLANKWAAFLPWIIAIIGIVAGGFGLRQSGKNAAYAEMAQKEAKDNAKALQVTQNVTALSDADVDRILRQQFGTN